MPSLQELIDSTPEFGALTLNPPNGEFEGPVVFRRAINLDGQGGTIWSPIGPVATVEADNVVLQNLNVDITGREEHLLSGETNALVVDPGCKPKLQNVSVRGDVLGLKNEEGHWRYPRSLRLNKLVCNRPHTFLLRIETPIECRFLSEIDGVMLKPEKIPAGVSEVTLILDPLRPDTRVRGTLTLKSANISRQIQLTGSAARTPDEDATLGDGQVLWEAQTVGDVHIAEPPKTVPPPKKEPPPKKPAAPQSAPSGAAPARSAPATPKATSSKVTRGSSEPRHLPRTPDPQEDPAPTPKISPSVSPAPPKVTSVPLGGFWTTPSQAVDPPNTKETAKPAEAKQSPDPADSTPQNNTETTPFKPPKPTQGDNSPRASRRVKTSTDLTGAFAPVIKPPEEEDSPPPANPSPKVVTPEPQNQPPKETPAPPQTQQPNKQSSQEPSKKSSRKMVKPSNDQGLFGQSSNDS